jgi:hypothetical protein
MQKIDRLGWTAGISLQAYGRSIGIRVNDSTVLEKLPRCLPYGWQISGETVVERLYSLHVGRPPKSVHARCFHVLYQDTARIERAQDLDQVFEALSADLRMYVAEYAKKRVFVHAGVVGWRGHAVLIPGRSFSGKSTLTAELVRAGCTYYSDEYAVLNARGRVHPFLKPFSLRNGGEDQIDVPAEQLGVVAEDQPLPVGLIVVSNFKPAARWRPRVLSTGQGVLELLANTVAARRQPALTLATLGRAVAKASVLKGNRGEAAPTAAEILRWLERNSGGPARRPK